MPPAPAVDLTGPASVVLAVMVALTGVFLAYRIWHDHRTRPPGAIVSPLDENHFAREGLRRCLGSIVMGLLAVGIFLGGRVAPQVGGKANPLFVQVWAGVVLLLLALVLLGMLDWVSSRIYARRVRARLTREGLAIVEAELRQKLADKRARAGLSGDGDRNGHAHPSD